VFMTTKASRRDGVGGQHIGWLETIFGTADFLRERVVTEEGKRSSPSRLNGN